MEAVGLHPIVVYIRMRQETKEERVAFRPIYELCTEAERIQWTMWLVLWWYQERW